MCTSVCVINNNMTCDKLMCKKLTKCHYIWEMYYWESCHIFEKRNIRKEHIKLIPLGNKIATVL